MKRVKNNIMPTLLIAHRVDEKMRLVDETAPSVTHIQAWYSERGYCRTISGERWHVKRCEDGRANFVTTGRK